MAQVVVFEDLPLRIAADGTWLHGGEPLHPRVAKLFARHVVPAADGSYSVVLGRARQRLEVDDTAFHVRRLDGAEGPGPLPPTLTLSLSDGQDEPLDPATLMQSADHVLYARICRHGLAVPCRFTPYQYHALALHMELEGGQAYLPLGGRRWPIGPFMKTT